MTRVSDGVVAGTSAFEAHEETEVSIPVERVYRSIGVTEAVDPRNRDVLAMTLLLRHIDRTMAIAADEWDEFAAAGARIVDSVAGDANDLATEKVLLSCALHEARAWLNNPGRLAEVRVPASLARVPTQRVQASRVRIRTVIRDM